MCSNNYFNAFIHCFHCFEMQYSVRFPEKETLVLEVLFFSKLYNLICSYIIVTNKCLLFHFSLDVQRMNVMALKTLFNSKIINNSLGMFLKHSFLNFNEDFPRLHVFTFLLRKAVWLLEKLPKREKIIGKNLLICKRSTVLKVLDVTCITSTLICPKQKS